MIVRKGQIAGPVWTALMVAVLLAISVRWLERWRLTSPDRSGVRLFHVTTGADSGPGSLREGIFAADRADGRARITIDVRRIVLETPLPPLLNPAGVVIDARVAHTTLDAGALLSGPVLDLSAPDCVIAGLRIERARGEAILVRGRGAHISGVAVVESNVAVYQAESAVDLVVEESAFERNAVGVQAAGDGSPVTVRNSRFQNHRRAALWAVAPDAFLLRTGLHIIHNEFAGDHYSVVALNIPARIVRNTFAGAQAAAIYASGDSIVVRENRIRSGHNFGVYLERADHAVVADNELDHNCSGGVMVRNAQHTELRFNRVYANGYGILLIHGTTAGPNTVADNLIAQHVEDGLYVIGGSPVIRRNRLLQNRKNGLHLSSLPSSRGEVGANPLLDANVLSGNATDAVYRDRYVPAARDLGPAEPADCSWRLGGDGVQVARLGAGH